MTQTDSATTGGGDTPETDTMRLVGIVASAGGLEAVSQLVQNLPEHSDAVYLVAQHLAPTHKSLLTSLIAREAHLPVIELQTDETPKADTIYITPPNWDVVFEDGLIRLRQPSGHPASPKPSADRLFKSMAETCGENCVGVILSGTGSDGSYGVRAIREAGGITIAQDTATAKYDGMPASAIETGCIDLTLTPEQIGQHLERILALPRDFEPLRQLGQQPGQTSALLQMLLARTRVDFRDYKENTVNRQIIRRMAALGIEDYDEYVEYCRASEDELDALHRDLLISVTRFFRDPEQFEQLAAEIRSRVADSEGRQIRVWVAGCATGEEAYSIAILFAEALGGPDQLMKERLQIFATDIDDRALDIGRRGTYPLAAAQDIPAKYLDRYFVQNENNLIVANELRSVTLFSKHNMFHDPPFINVDLVSLRNVLIYFNTMLQERVLNRVLYALAPEGLLFLGTAESVGNMDLRLESRAGTDKIFGKRSGVHHAGFALADAGHSLLPSRRKAPAPPTGRKAENPDRHFEALMRSVARNGFLATRTGEMVRVLGDISNFIEISEHSSLSLNTRILKTPFRDEATSLITIAGKGKERRSGRWHAFDTPGGNRAQLECFPIVSPTGGEDQFLFAINTKEETETDTDVESLSEAERLSYIARLEAEMQTTREALQQTVEELQTSNEELQSVNEEMQSTNEELQSTNEELETSNEELQSTNEELITVNEEMQINAAELQTVSTELLAILAASPYMLIVVDQSLMIRKASDRALDFFGLGELPQAGIHLSRCEVPEGFPELTRMANDVFSQRKPVTLPIETGDQVYGLNFAPYFDPLGGLMGLTISTLEFDTLPFRKTTEIMFDMVGVSNWRLNLHSREVTWSEAIYRIHGLDPENGPPAFDDAIDFYHPDDRDMVQELVGTCIEKGHPFGFEARIVRPDGGVAHVQSAGALVRNRHGEPAYIVGAFRDLSDQLNNEMLIRNFAEVQDDHGIGFYSYDVANDRPYWSRGLYRLLGLDPDRDRASVQGAIELFHPDDTEMVATMLTNAIETGVPFAYRARLKHSDGGFVLCEGKGRTRQLEDGTSPMSTAASPPCPKTRRRPGSARSPDGSGRGGDQLLKRKCRTSPSFTS